MIPLQYRRPVTPRTGALDCLFEIWHASTERSIVDDRTVDSHIKRLRRKFWEKDQEFDRIETLYGAGYRFKEM